MIARREFGEDVADAVFGGIAELARAGLGQELIEMGMAKGRAEGRAESLRDAIFEDLRARFGRIDAELRTRIERLASVPTLKALHRQALRAESLASFERALPRR